ncbi:hypothetical protein J6590_018749 [Homalodisca vitripennis]|nr:hypothetical protein J6590_018749 [Homalodisca vitripennis]
MFIARKCKTFFKLIIKDFYACFRSTRTFKIGKVGGGVPFLDIHMVAQTQVTHRLYSTQCRFNWKIGKVGGGVPFLDIHMVAQTQVTHRFYSTQCRFNWKRDVLGPIHFFQPTKNSKKHSPLRCLLVFFDWSFLNKLLDGAHSRFLGGKSFEQ